MSYSASERETIVLDRVGTDVVGESVRLRVQATAALIALPGGVPAWAVTESAVLKTSTPATRRSVRAN